MGDMRRARAVGQATRVSEAYVVFMLRTWESGGAEEGDEEEGEAKGSTWPICAACALWVGIQASMRCM